jgi:hypothetical protein
MVSMAKLQGIKTRDGGRGLLFYCPGCKFGHFFQVEKGPEYDGAPIWEWNGDIERPTFSPSLGVNMSTEVRCHLFVRDGMIQFLNDSHHALAGQTVAMEDVDG